MYVNAHVVNQARAIPALAEALRRADLVYCDGYGVRLAARVLGRPVPYRMTGADWIWALARLCELDGHGLYLRRVRAAAGAGRGRTAAPPLPAAARVRRPPRVLRSRLAPQRAGDRAHQRAAAADRAGRDGHAEAGVVGRPLRRPARRLRNLDRRLAVRLRLRSYAARAPMARGQWSRMDLQTRDRASSDVAAVSAREPGVPEEGADRVQAPDSPEAAAAARRPPHRAGGGGVDPDRARGGHLLLQPPAAPRPVRRRFPGRSARSSGRSCCSASAASG